MGVMIAIPNLSFDKQLSDNLSSHAFELVITIRLTEGDFSEEKRMPVAAQYISITSYEQC